MVDVTRRGLLGAGAGGLAAASVLSTARAGSFGNPDEPPQGAINATNPASVTDPGPRNPAIADQFPAAESPAATDTNNLPQYWASFNNAAKRIQNGGWARQVNQVDFAISETITGVNMRLTAGGIRELHWHDFAEWAFVTNGTCRVTVLDPLGQALWPTSTKAGCGFFRAVFRTRCRVWVPMVANLSSPSMKDRLRSSVRCW
jgi:oxalate decarboxylase